MLVWPIIFRVSLAVLFAGGLVLELFREKTPDWHLARGWLLLCAWLAMIAPHVAIAVGLLGRRRWAAWLAVSGDCTVAALGLGTLLAGQTPDAAEAGIGLSVWRCGLQAAGIIPLMEGFYLLRKLRQPWTSILLYMPVAAVSFFLGWNLGLIGD